MTASPTYIHSIAVIGAGIIGLACALELADRGLKVSLHDKQWPPRGASWAAAGMLAPAYEAAAEPGTHPALYELCDKSARLWPDWAKQLETRTALPSGYVPGPSLAVASNEEEAAKLEAIGAALKAHENGPRVMNAREVNAIEPSLSARLQSALLLPSDGQADNRAAIKALVKACEMHSRITIENRAAPLRQDGKGLDHAGHDATLICAGWGVSGVKVIGSSQTKTLKDHISELAGIESYGGQMLSVEPVAGAPKMTIRAGGLYIVPKVDRIIIGATTEPGRVLDHADPNIVANLKAKAEGICPPLKGAAILETWAGVRPGTRDHAPLLGQASVQNVFIACGHYRNGILLAPITAKMMADRIVDGMTGPLAKQFSVGRFITAAV